MDRLEAFGQAVAKEFGTQSLSIGLNTAVLLIERGKYSDAIKLLTEFRDILDEIGHNIPK